MPRWWMRLRFRLLAMFGRHRLDDELDEELDFHRQHSEQMYRAQGMSADAARRAATLDLDGVVAARYSARDARGTRPLEELGRDVIVALRGLRHSAGFTTTIVCTCSIGVALVATAAIVADSYLRDPLPAPASERLFHVWYSGQSGPPVNGGFRSEPQHLHHLDWAALSDVVEMADASVFARYTSTDGPSTRELVGLRVARGAASALGVTVVAGRTFSDDDFLSATPAMLLSHHLWQDRYGGDPGVIGSTILLGATGATQPPLAYRVIGVTTPGFRYVREFSRPPVDVVATITGPGVAFMIRLREGVPVDDAARRISAAIRETPGIVVPEQWSGVRLESVHERFVAPVRPVVTAGSLATWCVLVLVTANGAILVLLRNLRRQREAQVRVALGASRRHLLRSIATEAGLVSVTAVTLGLLGAHLALVPLRPALIQALGRVPPGDGSATILSMEVMVGAAVFAALMIAGWTLLGALAIRRVSFAGFKIARGTTDRPSIRLASLGFLVVQAAISIALVTGCVLMIRTATSLLGVDLGLHVEHVWRSRLALPVAAFPNADAARGFYERLASIAADDDLVIGYSNWPLFVEAARPQAIEVTSSPTTARAAVTAVSAGYFEALSIPTVDGRSLSDGDRVGTASVAVVSESFARRMWPGERGVGQRLRTVNAASPAGPWHTVVGVVGDVRQMPNDEDAHDVYVPMLQGVPPLYAVVVMRARQATDVTSVAGLDALRRFETLSGAVDRRAVVGTVTPLAAEYDKLVATPRLLAALLTGFGIVATLLTMIGLYGVTAHAVRQREAELAIRMALGASRVHVATRLLGTAAGVLCLGGATGALAAAGLGKVLATQLFDVATFDIRLSALVIGGTALCLMAATVMPVRRATRIAPARLLRDL